MISDLKDIVESLLFVSDDPLSIPRIQQILDLPHGDPVREALTRLHQEYETRKGGFCIEEVAGGFQLRSRPENKQWIQRMLQSGPARLSKAALETLAIIAYKQPIMRSDIEHIRGVDSGGVLRVLMERNLIRILGRKEIPGRPLIYGTTRRFLEVFGLKDLKDLPIPAEVDASRDARDERDDRPDASETPNAGKPDEPGGEMPHGPEEESDDDASAGWVTDGDLARALPETPLLQGRSRRSADPRYGIYSALTPASDEADKAETEAGADCDPPEIPAGGTGAADPDSSKKDLT